MANFILILFKIQIIFYQIYLNFKIAIKLTLTKF